MANMSYEKTKLEKLSQEIREALNRAIDRKDFVLGEDVQAFEAEVAAYLGIKHAIVLEGGWLTRLLMCFE